MFYPALILRRHYHGLLDEPTVLVLPAALLSKLRRVLRSSPEGEAVVAVAMAAVAALAPAVAVALAVAVVVAVAVAVAVAMEWWARE